MGALMRQVSFHILLFKSVRSESVGLRHPHIKIDLKRFLLNGMQNHSECQPLGFKVLNVKKRNYVFSINC